MAPNDSALQKKANSQHSRSRYRLEGEHTCIEINLRTPAQLFDMRDPAPFIERDLDDDAVEYIVSAAEEFSLKTPLKLVLHFSEHGPADLGPHEMTVAIRTYFDYQADLLRRKLERMVRRGRRYLLASFAFLAACIFGSELASHLPSKTLARILGEGLIISGWVALWRPLQIFLYDWVPLMERRRYYDKLSRIDIKIAFPPGARA